MLELACQYSRSEAAIEIIQFHNGGFTWVDCRLTIIDDLLRDNFGLSFSSLHS